MNPDLSPPLPKEGPGLALVLTGGGARAAYQVGVLAAKVQDGYRASHGWLVQVTRLPST